MGEEIDEEQVANQKKVYNKVTDIIKAKCRIVNQKLLLEDLYETRMCNKLLVPEADEDVLWIGNATRKRARGSHIPYSNTLTHTHTCPIDMPPKFLDHIPEVISPDITCQHCLMICKTLY